MNVGENAVTDEAFGKGDECFVDVSAAVVAGAEVTKAAEPTESSFRDPTKDAQAATVVFGAACQVGLDMTIPEFASMRLAVVGAVCIEFIRPLAGTARFSGHGRNLVDQWDELGQVMAVCSGGLRLQRDAAGIGDHVMLASWFTTIGGVRAGLFAATEGSNGNAVDGGAGEIQFVGFAEMLQQRKRPPNC